MLLDRPLSVVAPTLDTDILPILALTDASFTTGQLHRMLPNYSQEGIRKALGRLVGQGVVDVESVGQAHGYRFNHEHLAAAPIVELAQMRSTLLRRLEERITSWKVPALYAAVFGSAGRGAMHPGSDIDVLLVRPDHVGDDGDLADSWEQQVGDLVCSVSRWTGNDTRPLQLTHEQVRFSISTGVLGDVLREGLTVAGRRSWLLGEIGADAQA